jgi:hypothetical protein
MSNRTAIAVLNHHLQELLSVRNQALKAKDAARKAAREAECSFHWVETQIEHMFENYKMIARQDGVEISDAEHHLFGQECEGEKCQDCCPHERKTDGICDHCDLDISAD